MDNDIAQEVGLETTTLTSLSFSLSSYGKPLRSSLFTINRFDAPDDLAPGTPPLPHANFDHGCFHVRVERDRGWNVLVVDYWTGTPIGEVHSFDSYGGRVDGGPGSGCANDQMALHIKTIPDGSIVLVLASDFATASTSNSDWSSTTFDHSSSAVALKSIGAGARLPKGRESYALVGFKGRRPRGFFPVEQFGDELRAEQGGHVVTVTWTNPLFYTSRFITGDDALAEPMAEGIEAPGSSEYWP